MIYSYHRCPPCEQIGLEVIKVYWNQFTKRFQEQAVRK